MAHGRSEPSDFADALDALDALHSFADQEGSIAPFESNAADLAIEVDRAIQREIDLLRDK